MVQLWALVNLVIFGGMLICVVLIIRARNKDV